MEADLLLGRRPATEPSSITLAEWMEDWLDDDGKNVGAKRRDRTGLQTFPDFLSLPLGDPFEPA